MEAIPEIPLMPTPATEEARSAIGYQWAGPGPGGRHKLGGRPDWLQSDETPRCECGKAMTFYAQLDSIGDKFDLADAGIIYVFVCFDCFTTRSLLQCG